jgi:hypothetical protein
MLAAMIYGRTNYEEEQFLNETLEENWQKLNPLLLLQIIRNPLFKFCCGQIPKNNRRMWSVRILCLTNKI